MKEKQNLAGRVFGRWTVLDDCIVEGKNRKWLCRCQCGTQRYVLARSLLSGGSMSCGCLRKETAADAISHDLIRQKFGELTVLGKAEKQWKSGGVWWHCRCSCGTECDFPGTLLVTGRRTRCSGKSHQKNYAHADITGRRFGRLVAISPTEERDVKGSVLWHCRCDCGNEVDVPYNSLMYANQVSCGCKKKEHDKSLQQLQTHVDGTSLDHLKKQKLPTNNTTGVRGVYLIKGKYVAKVVFRKKAYYLGSYRSLEDAAEARKRAEEELFGETVAYYEKWQVKANIDPEWAKENPVQIFVNKTNDELQISFLPVL